jgi:hypothetical protein
MKNQIRKIIKEEMGDFDWANQIDPLQSFEDYFYGDRSYGYHGIPPGGYTKRGIEWWRNWIHDVEMAHASFLDDIEELNDMVHYLVNPTNGSEKYKMLADDVYSYLSPSKNLNGRSYLMDLALEIKMSYDYLGPFAEKNNLTILETLDIFKQWLGKMKKEGKPLHEKS